MNGTIFTLYVKNYLIILLKRFSLSCQLLQTSHQRTYYNIELTKHSQHNVKTTEIKVSIHNLIDEVRKIYQNVQHLRALQAQIFYWYHQRAQETFCVIQECRQKLKSFEIQQMLKIAVHVPAHLRKFYGEKERMRVQFYNKF